MSDSLLPNLTPLVMCMAWPQAKSQAKPGQKSQGQAKPNRLACDWLWPGLDFMKAKANGLGQGFHLDYPKLFLTTIVIPLVLLQVSKIKIQLLSPFMDISHPI